MFDRLTREEIAEIVTSNLPETVIDATPEFIMQLRERAMSTGRQQPVVYVRLDRQSLDALFGFRLAKEGEIPRFFRDGRKEKWVADWNKSNRQIVENNLKKLFAAHIGGRFVPSPETWIFLSDGSCGSAQHRGWTAREAMLADPNYRVVVCLAFGFDYRLADVLDRQAQRKAKEVFVRNHIIADELVEDLPEASKIQTTLNRELVSLLKIVWLRSQGKDVKAGGEFSQEDTAAMLDRIPGVAEFIVNLYRLGKEADGVNDSHGVKLFGRPLIGAMLVLAANTDNAADWRIEGRSRIFDLPDTISLPDSDIVSGFLSVLNDNRQTAPFAVFYAKWSKATDRHSQRKTGMLQGLVEHYLSTREETIVEPEVDATTGQPVPGAVASVEWTCSPVSDSDYARIDPGSPAKPAPGTKQKPPAYVWNCFGGLDCGYLGKVTSISA